jgi:hypothetical protein
MKNSKQENGKSYIEKIIDDVKKLNTNELVAWANSLTIHDVDFLIARLSRELNEGRIQMNGDCRDHTFYDKLDNVIDILYEREERLLMQMYPDMETYQKRKTEIQAQRIIYRISDQLR